jgi:succinate dehydrogenase flavin-adding protein (antitoxin of CptAB toxin-antitoxin module)
VSDDLDYRRLRWQCRRGNLELDLVLREFLEHEYSCLTVSERKVFGNLLALPDTVLLRWLFPSGQDNVASQTTDQYEYDEGLRSIVERLQQKSIPAP